MVVILIEMLIVIIFMIVVDIGVCVCVKVRMESCCFPEPFYGFAYSKSPGWQLCHKALHTTTITAAHARRAKTLQR